MNDLMNAAPCGFVSFGDDGIIRAVNQGLIELVGYTRAELEGKHLESIFSVGGKVFYHTHFLPLLRLQGRAEEIYFALRCKGGDEVPVLINGVRSSRDGEVVNDCIMVRMRMRRRYEDEILRAKKEAEAASAAKAKFLSMMSHDLRTPLQAISGYASVLGQEFHGPLLEAQRDDLAQIQNATRELSRLMDDILTFAQMESGRVQVRLRSVPVDEALERAESLVRLRFTDAELAYQREPLEPGLAVKADPDRLQQILLNLVTNAIKFTPAGGRVATAAEREGDRARIRVRDTGPGIPGEYLDRIFEPFTQVETTQANQGVGLGLAISRELARAMGGDLTVESLLGKGSTFTIELPAASVSGAGMDVVPS
ncbi:MAG TPA: PAS domain-containing sensor histidine kinase [Thermoanaerobaculia bacterium]|nr:PAS domain-containing sensor histidine kinase [Thermoanaerobaculia bacterium]